MKRELTSAARIPIGAAAGLSISSTLAVKFFGFNDRAFIDRSFLLLIPAFVFIVCAYFLIPFLERQINRVTFFTRGFLFSLAFLSALAAIILNFDGRDTLSIAAFVSLLFVFWAAVIPSAPFVADFNPHYLFPCGISG
jgi:hypothetical protein